MEIVAAITDNGVIGSHGDMPWHLPADLKHFKKLTSGHAIIMGRRTWESIGKPLPRRLNIVITRQQHYEACGAVTVHSIEDAMREVQTNRAFIIGGGEIYRCALPKATQLHLTRIHATIDGDTYFPIVQWSQWEQIGAEEHASDEHNSYCLTYETWVRNQ